MRNPSRLCPAGLRRFLSNNDATSSKTLVGSSLSKHVDVRLISATNRDLESGVANGTFRQDLYYRLKVATIKLPTLRERREDIPLLAEHFLRRHARRYTKAIAGFDPDGMQALLAHPWPGNVRELDHAIERAVLLAAGDSVRASDLGLRAAAADGGRLEDLTLEEVERVLIEKALKRHAGNVSEAAKALGLSRSALYRRLAQHGL